jgi:glyoxylase-like metal-dependent hydrolase (beta-lactamase superfamily II)
MTNRIINGTEAASQEDGVFVVGEVTCRVIRDGTAPYPPEVMFANITSEARSAALAGRLDDQGDFISPYRSLLLQTPGRTLLVDTGLGHLAGVFGTPAGQLLNALTSAGFRPDDIDVVVLSHAHPDHIGGLLHDDRLTFPRARHVMSTTEWAFWTGPDNLARMPEMLAAPARALLPPLAEAGVLDLVSGEVEVDPGVWLRPAPGHTPGHCVVSIASAGEHTTFLADAVLDELNFEHPGWMSAIDLDTAQTERTRRRLLSEAALDGSWVLAYHMDGIGRAERRAGGFTFLRGSE